MTGLDGGVALLDGVVQDDTVVVVGQLGLVAELDRGVCPGEAAVNRSSPPGAPAGGLAGAVFWVYRSRSGRGSGGPWLVAEVPRRTNSVPAGQRVTYWLLVASSHRM